MKRVFLLIISICLMAMSLAQADILTSDNFEETTQTLDSGGVDQDTFSLNFDLLQASFGQTAVGYSASPNFSVSGGYFATPLVAREPGQIHMDVTGLVRDLTETGVQVDEITAVVVNPSTKIFISADGQDGSKVFTDTIGRHTITAVGDARIDTSESHSGGSSAFFDGQGDYLAIPDSEDWNFGANDFTIDFWVKFNSAAGNQTFLAQQNPGSTEDEHFLFYEQSTNSIRFAIIEDSAGLLEFRAQTFSPATNTWYHVELVRNSNTWYVFVDGTALTITLISGSFSSSMLNLVGSLGIGAKYLETGGPILFFNGWIDEFKIMKIDQTAIEGEEFIASDVALTEGPATIHLIAKDQFNQTTEMDVNFTLDVTPPTRPTLDPVETPTGSPTQMISGTKEANTSIWFIKDAQETEAIVDPNLRLYIPADGGDGSQNFVDAGKGHAIAAVGDAQVDTEQSQSGGASALFDGSPSFVNETDRGTPALDSFGISGGDYLSIPDSEDWNFGTEDFTIDFWMNSTTTGVIQRFISQGSPGNHAFALRIDLDNKLYFLAITEAGATQAYYITESAVSILDGEWHHLELVRNGTSLYIFVDGVSQALSVIIPIGANSLANGTTDLIIGADFNGGEPFNGWIDELKISVFDEEVVPQDELTTWAYPLDLNEGENVFEIYAKDEAGNESTRVGGEIYLDVQNPNVKIVYPANGSKVNQTTVDILGTVDDDQTQVTIEANGYFYPAIVQNRMFSVDNVVLLDNTWNAVTAVANSPGGKEFVDPVSIRCETSATLPSTPTLNSVTSPTNQSSQTLSGTKQANTYLWLNGVKRADVSFASTSWSFNLPLLSGGNPILFYVKDSDSTSAKVSGTVSSTIFYDDTPPTRPQVIDDGTISDSTSFLHAKWTSSDAETDIVDYRAAIGTTKGGQDVMAFTSAGTETQITQGGLSLGQGQTYYFTVIAKNTAGTESSPGYSDGIRVNGSVPKITNVTLADKSKIYQGTNGMNIAVTAEDKDGDTLEYRFTIDGQIAQNWSVDADYSWNISADSFGKKHVVVEARDPIGGSAYKDLRVFVLKQPLALP